MILSLAIHMNLNQVTLDRRGSSNPFRRSALMPLRVVLECLRYFLYQSPISGFTISKNIENKVTGIPEFQNSDSAKITQPNYFTAN